MIGIILAVAAGVALGHYVLRALQYFADWRYTRAFQKQFSDDWDRAYAPAVWVRKRRLRALRQLTALVASIYALIILLELPAPASVQALVASAIVGVVLWRPFVAAALATPEERGAWLGARFRALIRRYTSQHV